jgi:hypothetical protein
MWALRDVLFEKNFLPGQIKTESCIILGFYTVSSGNFLPLFWDNHYTLHNNPEEHSFHLLLGRSLKSYK